MILTRKNSDFPNKLKQSKISKLYYRGNIDLLKRKSIAIVGSRKMTNYGRKVARRFSDFLSKEGYAIISGLAIGVDSYAHIAALENDGRTIAVLPSGINQIYPKENIILAQRIINNGGLIISEYEDEEEVSLKCFPKRNELIARLSDCILIIEAGEKSGSTITGRKGFQLGIPVFCVPGRIDDKYSKGTNLLISQGANIILEPKMIIDFLEAEETFEELNKTQIEFEKLNDESDGIYSLISDKPISIDEISKQSELSISTIIERLLMLEINGAIKKIPGEKYIRSNYE